jgi:hypothetical protein
VLKTQALDAYSEEQAVPVGTSMRVILKDALPGDAVASYIRENIVYPSVPIHYFDNEKAVELYELAAGLGIAAPPITWSHEDDSDLSVVTKRNIEACREVLAAIGRQFPDVLSDAQRAYFLSTFFTINPRSIIGKPPRQPYFMWLDSKFSVIEISNKITRALRNAYNTFVVWVPVRILDENIGLDWFSLHGFVVHAGSIKRLVGSFRVLSDEFENDDLTEFYGEDDVDDWDEDGRLFQADDYAVDLVDMMRRRRKRVKADEQTPVERDLQLVATVDRILRRDENGDLVDLIDYSDQHIEATAKSAKSRANLDNVLIEVAFLEWFHQIDNSVFQDGIHLPIQGWLLAPLGACRATCNLTGNARFDLNASRNMVNESPTLLKLWAKQVGSIIQQEVLKTTSKVLRENKIDYELDILFSTKLADDGALGEYTRVRL